jgi:hypothetical protein
LFDSVENQLDFSDAWNSSGRLSKEPLRNANRVF